MLCILPSPSIYFPLLNRAIAFMLAPDISIFRRSPTVRTGSEVAGALFRISVGISSMFSRYVTFLVDEQLLSDIVNMAHANNMCFKFIILLEECCSISVN